MVRIPAKNFTHPSLLFFRDHLFESMTSNNLFLHFLLIIISREHHKDQASSRNQMLTRPLEAVSISFSLSLFSLKYSNPVLEKKWRQKTLIHSFIKKCAKNLTFSLSFPLNNFRVKQGKRVPSWQHQGLCGNHFSFRADRTSFKNRKGRSGPQMFSHHAGWPQQNAGPNCDQDSPRSRKRTQGCLNCQRVDTGCSKCAQTAHVRAWQDAGIKNARKRHGCYGAHQSGRTSDQGSDVARRAEGRREGDESDGAVLAGGHHKR